MKGLMFFSLELYIHTVYYCTTNHLTKFYKTFASITVRSIDTGIQEEKNVLYQMILVIWYVIK